MTLARSIFVPWLFMGMFLGFGHWLLLGATLLFCTVAHGREWTVVQFTVRAALLLVSLTVITITFF